MDFYELISKRHSGRNYSSKTISKEVLEKIISAAKSAPSSRNKKPVYFFTVTDRQELLDLSLAKQSGSEFIKDAAAAIIVTGDMQKSDVWIEDCSIAMTYLHLAATEEGLESCWVQCRNRTNREGVSSAEYIGKRFSIPANLQVLAVLSLGVK